MRVSSHPASSNCADGDLSGFPESCVYGWADDDSPTILELCIRALDRE
jgi:hypothetical protein